MMLVALFAISILPGNVKAQISSGTYSFSGGNGSPENPFKIATAQDLLDLSAAVDAKLNYRRSVDGDEYSYAASNYQMTADIDMSAVQAGPFIVCKRTIQRQTAFDNDGISYVVSYVTKIIPATKSGDNYTCQRMTGDIYGTDGETGQSDDVIVTEGSTIVHGRDSVFTIVSSSGKEWIYNYRTEWEYSYYKGVTSLPISALILPIGSQASFISGNPSEGNASKKVDTRVSIPFLGVFDGDNHTISNLTMVADATSLGLFGYVSGNNKTTTVIKNLNVTNANITSMGEKTAVICGSLDKGTIQNCSVTNSVINAQGWVGGIAGNMTFTGSESNGDIIDCSAQDNEFNGGEYVGGLVGKVIEALYEDKTIPVSGDANNILNGETTGTIAGSADDYTGYEAKDPDLTDDELANIAISKLVPDYCYINNGGTLNPDNSSDKAKLDKLAAELDGTQTITDNIVLPDVSKLSQSFTVNIAKVYGDPAIANSGNSGIHWYLNKEDGVFPAGLTESDLVKASDENAGNYGDVRTKGSGTTKYSYFYVNGTEYLYVVREYYGGWSDALKEHVKSYYADAVSAKLENEKKYYTLTAKEVTIDQNNGGGLLDKGNQLTDVTINFKRQFITKQWNLEGYAQVGGNLTVGYLNNNVDENGQTHDIAALRYNYNDNVWTTGNSDYLLSWKKTYYSEGLFVWPFDAERLDTYDGSQERGKDALGIHPVVTQSGSFVDYATVDAGIKSHIESLENKASDATDGYWFALANPYIARLDIEKVLASLGEVQGNALYEYNINELDGSQTGWHAYSQTNNLKGGQGFMVAMSDAKKLSGAFGKESLYGWNYTPGGTVSEDGGAKKSAKVKSADDSQKMVFIAIDRYNRARTVDVYYGKGENGFDINDSYAMLSGAERFATEPYFEVEGRKVWTNAFSKLPYEAPVSFHSDNEGELVFAVTGNLGDIAVTFIDMQDGKETVMNDNNVRLNLEKGDNEGRYKVRFAKKSSSITDVTVAEQAAIKIWNNNREVSVSGEQLQRVEVMNMLGQSVYSKQISGSEYKFGVTAESGAYIIKVTSANGTKSEKVIVK